MHSKEKQKQRRIDTVNALQREAEAKSHGLNRCTPKRSKSKGALTQSMHSKEKQKKGSKKLLKAID